MCLAQEKKSIKIGKFWKGESKKARPSGQGQDVAAWRAAKLRPWSKRCLSGGCGDFVGPDLSYPWPCLSSDGAEERTKAHPFLVSGPLRGEASRDLPKASLWIFLRKFREDFGYNARLAERDECENIVASQVRDVHGQTDVIQRLTDEKAETSGQRNGDGQAVIEEQLRQERLQREELGRQLQVVSEIDSPLRGKALEEKQKAAEKALEEKRSIEERLEKEKAVKTEAGLTARLAELAEQEQQQREEARKEQELRCRLEEERKQQQETSLREASSCLLGQ